MNVNTLVRPNKSAHYYLPDGTPFYEVECKSKPGTMRAVTRKDAEKAGAYPSVTTILAQLAKPGLESWKQTQAILAALTLPTHEGETLDDFAARVVADSQAESKAAANTGTEIHDACVKMLESRGKADIPAEYRPAAEKFMRWCAGLLDLDSVECEKSFCNVEDGFGGRIDVNATLLNDPEVTCFIDIKTQDTETGKAVKVYPEWALQLAAYCAGYDEPPCYNVVISRNEIGRIDIVPWNRTVLQTAESMFLRLLDLWGYMPSIKSEKPYTWEG